MEFFLSQKEFSLLQERSRLFNYLSSAFTKTYFAIGEGKFTIFLRGAKGALKFSFDVPVLEKKKVFQIDYDKWLNAITKLNFADEISLKLTEKSLKIFTPNNAEMISLGIINYEDNSSEVSVLNTFIESYATIKNKLILESDMAEALTAAFSMFSSAGHNNAVALKKKSVLYADRSIVLEAKFDNEISFLDKTIELHKYSIGFMLQAQKFGNSFFFTDDYNIIYWLSSNGDMSVVLISEPCEIAIPTEEELKTIRPESGGTFDIDHRILYNALTFFNGFYESSVWKPITFDVSPDKTRLHYKHPTTEISKELQVTADRVCSFTIGSEHLSRLLSLSIDRADSEATIVHFEYDDTAPGVRCMIGTYYDVVFAKLIS